MLRQHMRRRAEKLRLGGNNNGNHAGLLQASFKSEVVTIFRPARKRTTFEEALGGKELDYSAYAWYT